jgi:plasmid stability protein
MARALKDVGLESDVLATLERRALRHGHTLADEVRTLVDAAERLEPTSSGDFDDAAARFRRSLEGRRHTPSEVLQRETRDER